MPEGQNVEQSNDENRLTGEGPERLIDAQREVELDGVAMEAARRFVEDALIWLLVIRGNGLVVRFRDGEDSSIMRMSTGDPLTLGIRAYLASLGRTS